MRSVPGVGLVLAWTLLGELSPKRLSALAGVAPFNRDSRTMRGKREVWGVRTPVRAVLYMGAFVATRLNPILKGLCGRFLAAGKPEKVALVACMRELLSFLDAVLRDRTPWYPTHASTP